MIRKISLILFGLSSAAVIFSSCTGTKSEAKMQPPAFDMVVMRKIVDEENALFAKAFVSGDSTTLINHYTLDGKLFPPNSPTVEGRDAIAKLIKQFLTYGILEFKDETTNLYGAGDTVVEEGNLFMGDGKGNTIEKGKYIAVWKKVDGKWKICSNMWNTSLPAK